jgi:hypothetical protein
MSEEWPKIACLCPTYGRANLLLDAVACFLLQDYPGALELVVCNDSGISLRIGSAYEEGRTIKMINLADRFSNLGAKRQYLLSQTDAYIVTHWDDDDLYLPWHISNLHANLWAHEQQAKLYRRPAVLCVKPKLAWFMPMKTRCVFQMRGLHANNFEGQMMFYRKAALSFGYSEKDSGQALDLMNRFDQLKALMVPDLGNFSSYVYRWSGIGHVSRAGRDGFTALNRNMALEGDYYRKLDRKWAMERLLIIFHEMIRQQPEMAVLASWVREKEVCDAVDQ